MMNLNSEEIRANYTKVYGMPKAVVDAGLADQILDVDDIAKAIMACVKG